MMHAHPVASQPSASSDIRERTPAERSARFVRWLYGTQAGYVEIIAGTADPTRLDNITLDITTRRWLYVHPERPDLYDALAAYGQQLASSHGNVYVGVRLYTKQAKSENKRCEAYTLPSTKIFVDDAPADPSLLYSGMVQTSEDSRHGYYECDKPTTKDDARRVAAALGGDPSGIDLTQLVRLVGTFNTKRGGRFAVTGRATSTVYKLDDLRAHFPVPVKAPRQAVTPRSTEAAPLPADLFNVERIAAIRTRLDGRTSLLQTARSTVSYITKVPARIKPGTQTYRILTDATYRSQWRNKGGSWDASLVRYIVCKGLITVGYDADHIIALLDYLEDPETQELKGAGNLQGDYARLFSPDKLGTLYAQKQADQRQYHARQDRPQQHTADSYYAWLQTHQQDGRVLLKRRERAAAAGISTATLDRLEDTLEQAERIQIETPSDRSGSVVVLHGGVINILVTESATEAAEDVTTPTKEVLSGPRAERAEYGAAMGETANEAAMHKEHTAPCPSLGGGSGQDAGVASGDAGGACVPLAARSAAPEPVAPLAPRPTLTALVRDAFDAYAGAARLTNRRIMQYVAMNAADGQAWPRDVQLRAIAAERTRRQRQVTRSYWDALNAEIAGLRDVPQSKLEALHARLSRSIGAAVQLDAARQAGTAKPDAKMPRGLQRARALMPHVIAELERCEALEAARIAQHGYRTDEVQAMLDLAATVIEQQPPVKAAPVRVDAPESNNLLDVPPYDGRGLVERLYARLVNAG